MQATATGVQKGIVVEILMCQKQTNLSYTFLFWFLNYPCDE